MQIFYYPKPVLKFKRDLYGYSKYKILAYYPDLGILKAEPENHISFQYAKAAIDKQMQQKYLDLRSSEEIALCIERANEYGEKEEAQGRVPNYGAVYRTAIKEGWHSTQVEKKRKATAKAKREQAVAQIAHEHESAQQRGTAKSRTGFVTPSLSSTC